MCPRNCPALLSFFALLAASGLAAQGPPGGPPTPVPPELTVQVDCDTGETLGGALTQRADELTIEFSGTCNEDVLIRRGRMRLVGVALGAEIVGNTSPAQPFFGAVTVEGASNVTLADFTVRGARRGVSLLGGASARLERLTVRDNVSDGVLVQGSRAWIEELTVIDNGQDGIGAWDSSSIIFAHDVTTVIRRHGRVGLLVSGSSDATGIFPTRLEVGDHPFGLAFQLGASGQSLGLEALQNSIGVWVFLEASFSSEAEIHDNGEVGVLVTDGGMAEIRGTIKNNGFFGIRGEHDATVTFRGTMSGNATGMRLHGTKAFIANATVSDPVELLFGTRVDFVGGNSFTGGVSCDGTVLVRGDVACPAPLYSLRMGGVSKSLEMVSLAVPAPLTLEP